MKRLLLCEALRAAVSELAEQQEAQRHGKGDDPDIGLTFGTSRLEEVQRRQGLELDLVTAQARELPRVLFFCVYSPLNAPDVV